MKETRKGELVAGLSACEMMMSCVINGSTLVSRQWWFESKHLIDFLAAHQCDIIDLIHAFSGSNPEQELGINRLKPSEQIDDT